jgi:ABC-type transport system involved in Fe-S cluster assembly fused permease/ATPase subunit
MSIPHFFATRYAPRGKFIRGTAKQRKTIAIACILWYNDTNPAVPSLHFVIAIVKCKGSTKTMIYQIFLKFFGVQNLFAALLAVRGPGGG